MFEYFARVGWRPTIGDPSFMGWFTVGAYAAAALLAFLAAAFVRVGDDPVADRRRRWLWIGVALLMSFLCVNKQLDLQSLLTRIGRDIAQRGGWYDSRRIVQLLFVMAVAAAGIGTLVLVVRKTRFIIKEQKLLLAGVCFLLSFIIIRASSFHHVGEFLGRDIFGFRMNWLLELTGIGLITAAAVRTLRAPHRRR
jgi:hypothetical protein